ncbi:MAG: hypothetical protein V3T66_09520, partial [Alphaproteobacteria bacterium]
PKVRRPLFKRRGDANTVYPCRDGQGRFAVLNDPHDQLMSVGSHHQKKVALQNRHEVWRFVSIVSESPPGQGILRSKNP